MSGCVDVTDRSVREREGGRAGAPEGESDFLEYDLDGVVCNAPDLEQPTVGHR